MASLSGSKRKATAAASDSSPEAAGGAGDRPALRRRVDEAGATAGASRYAEFSDEDDESRAVPDEPSDDDMDDEEFNEKLVETPVPSDARMVSGRLPPKPLKLRESIWPPRESIYFQLHSRYLLTVCSTS